MADAQMSGNDPFASLQGFTSLLGMFRGGSSNTSSSGTTTSGSNISSAGIQQMLQDILGGTQGLSAVASGQKAAGLYGSTTNQLLTNNLLTQTAGELAKLQAGTTTTTSQNARTTRAPQFNPLASIGTLAGLTAGASILGPAVKTGYHKLGLDDLGQKLSDSIFGGGGAADVEATAPALADTIGATNITGLTGSSVADTLGSVGALDLGGATTAAAQGLTGVGAAATDAGVTGAAGATGLGLDAAAADSAAVDASLASVGGDAAISAGADVAGFTAADAAASAGVDAAASGGFLDTLASIGTAAAASWVICTEMHAQKRLATELYMASAKRAMLLSPQTLRGYQYWAIPVTRVLRKYPILSALVAPIVKSRCEYLLGKPRVWGWLTVKLGEPLCGWLGKRAVPEDWRTLYE